MKELSLHILDIAQNALAAGAEYIDISLTEDAAGRLEITITDNGCGMTAERVRQADDPFFTTRAAPSAGLGLPLYRLAAELTGGSLSIRSAPSRGTAVSAVFFRSHLDCPPPGDLAATAALLIQGNPAVDISYRHTTPAGTAQLSSRQLRQALPGISLSEPAVFTWSKQYLSQQEAQLEGAET